MAVCGESAPPHRGVSFACAFPCRPRCFTILPDEAAKIFSQAFYRALIASKRTVKDAFDIAVSTVNSTVPTAAAKFLLLPSGECDGVKRLRFVFHMRCTTFLYLRQQYAGNMYPLLVLIVMLIHLSGTR